MLILGLLGASIYLYNYKSGTTKDHPLLRLCSDFGPRGRKAVAAEPLREPRSQGTHPHL